MHNSDSMCRVSIERMLIKLIALVAISLIYGSWGYAAPLRRQQRMFRNSHFSSNLSMHLPKQASILAISSLCLIPMQMTISPAFAVDPVTPLVWKSGKNPVVQNKNDPKEVCICVCFEMYF